MLGCLMWAKHLILGCLLWKSNIQYLMLGCLLCEPNIYCWVNFYVDLTLRDSSTGPVLGVLPNDH